MLFLANAFSRQLISSHQLHFTRRKANQSQEVEKRRNLISIWIQTLSLLTMLIVTLYDHSQGVKCFFILSSRDEYLRSTKQFSNLQILLMWRLMTDLSHSSQSSNLYGFHFDDVDNKNVNQRHLVEEDDSFTWWRESFETTSECQSSRRGRWRSIKSFGRWLRFETWWVARDSHVLRVQTAERRETRY